MHEVELAVILNDKPPGAPWLDRIGAYCMILDMGHGPSLRTAIGSKQPWFVGKSMDSFLVLGDLIPKDAIRDPHDVELELRINGELRQQDNTGNMIFKIGQQISYIEHDGGIELGEGDMLLTGTPEGIMPVNDGDLLEASLKSQGRLVSSMKHRICREQAPTE